MATATEALACREMGFALAEFKAGLEEQSDLRIRAAAEKAWLAVVDATNAYLAQVGVVIKEGIAAHAQRRKALQKFADEGSARDAVLLGKYLAFREELHGECFYGGQCGLEAELRNKLEKAKMYVVDLTKCEVAGP